MSRMCQGEVCSLCSSKFLERRHRHPDRRSPSILEESGLNIGNSIVCVWGGGATVVEWSRPLAQPKGCEFKPSRLAGVAFLFSEKKM